MAADLYVISENCGPDYYRIFADADIAGYEYVTKKPGVGSDIAGIVIVWGISNVPQRTLRGCEQMQHSRFCLQVDYAAADVETIPLE